MLIVTAVLLSFLSQLAVLAISNTHLLPAQLNSPSIAQKLLATAVNFTGTFPQYTTRDTGKWLWFSPNTWTSGFFPTTLYAMNTRQNLCPVFSLVGSADWLQLGREWSLPLVPIETHNTVEHDVGFISFPFQEELLVNPNNQSAQIAVNDFATELAARFSPIVGCTRSWDSSDPTDFQVIIDNMMNLEVLFASESLTGNKTLRDIAISHADKTMLNHVRPDGSSFHVVDYNATTGVVFDRRTSQGYADNSTWTRGQAWGLYGFTMMYNNTRLERYLDTARRMAAFFRDHIPPSGIVPWDFNAPAPAPADTSAAFIAVNGFLFLSQVEASLTPPNKTGAALWLTSALELFIITTDFAWKPTWESLFSNGTVNNPASPPNNLTGIVYGDYYFIKAGNTLLEKGLASC